MPRIISGGIWCHLFVHGRGASHSSCADATRPKAGAHAKASMPARISRAVEIFRIIVSSHMTCDVARDIRSPVSSREAEALTAAFPSL